MEAGIYYNYCILVTIQWHPNSHLRLAVYDNLSTGLTKVLEWLLEDAINYVCNGSNVTYSLTADLATIFPNKIFKILLLTHPVISISLATGFLSDAALLRVVHHFLACLSALR